MIAFCVCLILREFWWLQLVLNPKSDYLRSNWKRANISLSYILLATIKPKYSFDCSHQYINGFLFINYGLLIPRGQKFCISIADFRNWKMSFILLESTTFLSGIVIQLRQLWWFCGLRRSSHYHFCIFLFFHSSGTKNQIASGLSI